MAFNWRCPYCSHSSTIGDENSSSKLHTFNHNNFQGSDLGVHVSVVVCPNDECKQVSIKAMYSNCEWTHSGPRLIVPFFREWDLMPASSALVFPDYVPLAVRQDYEEACAIRDMSPKASATLSRRCLQGIIRDYWKIVRGRLVDEIDALQETIDPDTWEAIDAVRKIGNIGAHMEKDINIIIDVEPSEAQLLIELLETLIKDWYVARHKRQVHLSKIKAAAESKK